MHVDAASMVVLHRQRSLYPVAYGNAIVSKELSPFENLRVAGAWLMLAT